MLEVGLAVLPLVLWAVSGWCLATSRPGEAALGAARASLSATALALVTVLAAIVLGHGSLSLPAIDLGGLKLGWHFDSLSVVMATLVLGVSIIVQKYSLRYLDGDAGQRRFFGWLGFVTASSLSFVMGRNLAVMVASWWLVSLGVHRLLLYYPNRPGAREAARIKFYVSRLGDVVLVAGIVATWRLFGTLEFDQLAVAAVELGERVVSLGPWHSEVRAVHLIGLLFAVGAMTKSAQLPFHFWLPKTMEAPTPVSALMHAGIINAGGFLVVRLSPVLAHAPAALLTLFAVGTLTAIYGAAVMLVQNDVKRSLAYSTMSQMGFMMMQCGLGAFSAAILHLFMHGLFKAYMFLSAAGEVREDEQRLAVPTLSVGRVLGCGALAISLASLVVFASSLVTAVDWSNKSGGWLLAAFLGMTGAQAFFTVLASGKGKTATLAVGGVFGAACLTYLAGLNALEALLKGIVPSSVPGLAEFPGGQALMICVGLLFLGGMIMSWFSRTDCRPVWAEKAYVHALNRFYIDAEARLAPPRRH